MSGGGGGLLSVYWGLMCITDGHPPPCAQQERGLPVHHAQRAEPHGHEHAPGAEARGPLLCVATGLCVCVYMWVGEGRL